MRKYHDINERTNGIKAEMNSLRTEALTKLSNLGIHPDFVNAFSHVLSYVRDAIPESEKLIEVCDLNELHFLAIDGNVEGFRSQLLLNEQQSFEENFNLMEIEYGY